jgi:DNA invertase Pin-like site-specific DNA recombinase
LLIERDLLIERTQSGLARAKSNGKVLGRPSKTIAGQHDKIIDMREKGASVSELSRAYGISRASILRITDKFF